MTKVLKNWGVGSAILDTWFGHCVAQIPQCYKGLHERLEAKLTG